MFIILNRLRGTYSMFSKINGVFIAIIIYLLFGQDMTALTVGILSGLLYILGESFGWGVWVGALVDREAAEYTDEHEGGKYTGIEWLAKKLVKDPVNHWIRYCRVALSIRGIYWWVLTFLPLVYFNWYLPITSGVLLGLLFPVACELGYKTKFRFKLWKLKCDQSWDRQELFYGLFQDIVFISMLILILK